MVRLLLDAGADINEDGAIVYRDIESEEILYANGTALELAEQEGHVGVVNMLLESLYNLYIESDISNNEGGGKY
jgi:ankyrin repeat protein